MFRNSMPLLRRKGTLRVGVLGDGWTGAVLEPVDVENFTTQTSKDQDTPEKRARELQSAFDSDVAIVVATSTTVPKFAILRDLIFVFLSVALCIRS